MRKNKVCPWEEAFLILKAKRTEARVKRYAEIIERINILKLKRFKNIPMICTELKLLRKERRVSFSSNEAICG